MRSVEFEFAAPILIFFVIATIVVAIAIASFLAERKRQAALALAASGLGLSFRPERDYELAKQFQWLDALAQGSNRFASNVMSGSWQSHDALIFDYHYQITTHNGKTTQTSHHHLAVFALTLPQAFPEVRILPEDFGSKIAQALGWEDIDFESAEFSKKFVVRSPERKLAYDICNPRMMEFLLGHTDLRIEIEGPMLATWSAGRLRPEAIEYSLGRIASIRRLMPNYLFSERPHHA